MDLPTVTTTSTSSSTTFSPAAVLLPPSRKYTPSPHHDEEDEEDEDVAGAAADFLQLPSLLASTSTTQTATITTTTTATALRASPLLLRAYTRIRKSMSEGSMASAHGKLGGPPSHVTSDVRRRLRHQQHHPYPLLHSKGMEEGDEDDTHTPGVAAMTIGVGMLKKTLKPSSTNSSSSRGSSSNNNTSTTKQLLLPSHKRQHIPETAGGEVEDAKGDFDDDQVEYHSSKKQEIEASVSITTQTSSSTTRQQKGASFGGLGIYSATSLATSSRRARSMSEVDLTRPPFTMLSSALHHIVEPEARYSLMGRQSGVCTTQGLKPSNPHWQNQDNFILVEPSSSSAPAIYAVLDGHGDQGHLVSHHVRQHLPRLLIQADYDPFVTFRNMQQELVSCPFFDAACSGTTCVMVVAQWVEEEEEEQEGEGRGKKQPPQLHLKVMNIGDSRCVLGRRQRRRSRQERCASVDEEEEEDDSFLNPSPLRRYLHPSSSSSSLASSVGGEVGGFEKGRILAVPLTDDHKPDRPDEFRRIVAAGGQVGYRQYYHHPPPSSCSHQRAATQPSVTLGPARIWYEYRGDRNGLAMSRSFGDSAVHAAGGTSEPEVCEYVVQQAGGGEEGREEEEEEWVDSFLVLASDGLWDVMENQEVVELVGLFAKVEEEEEGGGGWDAKEAATALVQFARNRWQTLSPQAIDDITCMVVKLPTRGPGVGGGRERGGWKVPRAHVRL